MENHAIRNYSKYCKKGSLNPLFLSTIWMSFYYVYFYITLSITKFTDDYDSDFTNLYFLTESTYMSP